MRLTLGHCAALTAGLLLTGCAGSSTSATSGTAGSADAQVPSPTAVAKARNPVDILRMIDGCKIEDGVELGTRDVDGNLYANCSYFDNDGSAGTDVTARTGAGQPPEMGDSATPDDHHKVIAGPDFYVVITGDWGSYSKHIKPATIAQQVGGTVVPAS